MKYFPMENRTDVITAPNQTYLHEIKTSGRYLKIIAKSNVIIMKEETNSKTLSVDEALESTDYKYGFTTNIETETLPPGLNEDVIRTISAKKGEPEFMLNWRLKAYRHWLTMSEPTWQFVKYPKIDLPTEMVNAMLASRAYEANITAMDATQRDSCPPQPPARSP